MQPTAHALILIRSIYEFFATMCARARAFIRLLPLTLLGCANFSADGGLNRVSELSRERIGYSVPNVLNTTNSSIAEARISTLLSAPLSSIA
jgi:hypothetical protein